MEKQSCKITTWVFHPLVENSKQNIFSTKIKAIMEKPSCNFTTWFFHSHSEIIKAKYFSIKIQSKHGKTKL